MLDSLYIQTSSQKVLHSMCPFCLVPPFRLGFPMMPTVYSVGSEWHIQVVGLFPIRPKPWPLGPGIGL